MGIVETLALGLGASWASGINLYATVAILGFLDLIGVVTLPGQLELLSSPPVLLAAAALYVVEFFADKIPGIDSAWDMIHTFIRVPAGALMALGMSDQLDIGLDPEIQLALALAAGGFLSAGAHAAKAGTRVVINGSPEPITNLLASFFEDAFVATGLLFAVFLPVVFLFILGLFFIVVIWLLPKIWRGIAGFVRRFRHPMTALRHPHDPKFTLSLKR